MAERRRDQHQLPEAAHPHLPGPLPSAIQRSSPPLTWIAIFGRAADHRPPELLGQALAGAHWQTHHRADRGKPRFPVPNHAGHEQRTWRAFVQNYPVIRHRCHRAEPLRRRLRSGPDRSLASSTRSTSTTSPSRMPSPCWRTSCGPERQAGLGRVSSHSAWKRSRAGHPSTSREGIPASTLSSRTS